MTSYKYVESIGKELPDTKKVFTKVENDEIMIEPGKDRTATSTDFKEANIDKLPSTSIHLFNGESKKGHGIVGGFDSIAGKGEIGKEDPEFVHYDERAIKPTGLGFDIEARMHYLKAGKGYSFAKPKDSEFELHDCKSLEPPLSAYDLGFTKMSEWGYKSKDHGLSTTLLQIPGKVKTKNELDSEFKIDAVTRALVGAKNAYGYKTWNTVNAYGYLPENMAQKDRLATLSRGTTTLPSNIPYKIPFGYNRDSGYTSQGSPTVNKVPLSTHPGPINGKISNVGYHTPYRLNSSYPIVNKKLVA